MSKPIIALDMDGVIADWTGAMNSVLNYYGFDDVAELSAMTDRNLVIDEVYSDHPYFFEKLALIDCSSILLDYLDLGVKRGDFDLVIATHTVKGMKSITHERVRVCKVRWINKFIKTRWPNLIKYDGQIMAFTGEWVDTKSMIAKNNVILIDDYHRNVSEFESSGGHAILVNERDYDPFDVIEKVKEKLTFINKETK